MNYIATVLNMTVGGNQLHRIEQKKVQMGLGGQMHGILSDWCKNETTFNYNDYELLVSLNFPRLASKLEKITAQKYKKKTRLRNMPRNVLLGGGKSSLDPWS